MDIFTREGFPPEDAYAHDAGDQRPTCRSKGSRRAAGTMTSGTCATGRLDGTQCVAMTLSVPVVPMSVEPSRLPAARLWTQRLRLDASAPSLAAAVCDFHQRNLAHFAPWEPPRRPDYLTIPATEARLASEGLAFGTGHMWRYWLTRIEAPDHIIGQCQVSQIARGASQSAWLGYSLDEAAQGQGYMQEAMATLLDELFSPRVWLHRIQAAVRPDNGPSLRVMARMGFAEEGLCRDYLFINGAWRDHKIFAKVNPAWPRDAAPAC